MRTEGLYRATALMSVGTALSRITGLVRVSAMTFALGVAGTRLADAYNIANTTPNIVFELVLGGVLSSVFVPVLIAMRRPPGGQPPADPSPLISTTVVVLAAASLLTALGAPVIARIYTFRIADPVSRAQTHELAVSLLRWFSPQIFFYGVWGLARTLLDVRGRFGPARFVPVLNNLVWAGTLVAYGLFIRERSLPLTAGATAVLGAGTTLGVAVQALALFPYLRGEKLRFAPSLRDPAVRVTMRRAVYVLGYVVINQIGLWFVYALAIRQRGGVTAYQVAFLFFLLPHSLFAVSLIDALHPDLSAAAVRSDRDSFRQSFAAGVRGIAYLIVPSAIGYALLAEPIAHLLVARGAARPEDADLVAAVLRGFSAGLLFFSLFQLATRSFSALTDTRTPTVVNGLAAAVQMAVSVPLFALLGVQGLALGHATSYLAGSVILLALLHRRVQGGLDVKRLSGPVSKMLAASAGMGAGIWAVWLVTRSRLERPVMLLFSLVVGAVLYLSLSHLMAIPERRMLLGWARGWKLRSPTGEGAP